MVMHIVLKYWGIIKFYEKKSNGLETEAQAIFLNPFTVCSLRKRNFVNCPFVEEETNGSYPFANGLY
jgi:hypothetical protein